MADEAPNNDDHDANNPTADSASTSGSLLMPGGEEFDATLVEALFMNELLALNDLVSSEDGAGGGGGGGGDVTSGFESLAGLLGNSVGPADAVADADADADGSNLAPLPVVAEQVPPMLPSSPVLSGGGAGASAAAASEILPGTISDLSPLRPNRPHTVTSATTTTATAAAAGLAANGADGGAEGDEPKAAAASQLVHQFATLAGKLGIHLPPNVLSTLTAAAAANEIQEAMSSAATQNSAPVGGANQSTFARQLQQTAEESIAAIQGRKRKASGSSGGGGGSGESPPAAVTSNMGTADTTGTNAEPVTSSSAAATAAAYRRKKKPRLQDAESRLAALKAENETLKRHLANITDKTALIDQEREQAERKLSEMVQSGGSEEQIGPVLARFGEMYSDYGRRRQEELTFHLNQLERLAAPTTITKMTLWTCGQSDQFFFKPKSNPIAGILMKELDITPVQGRKIVERRDKIREVCDNIRQCLVLMTKLKSLCEHKQKVFHDRMTKCQEILNPLQVAKLLVWVDNHADTLESVCPGWGSERMSKRSSSATKLPTLADDGKANANDN